MFDKTIVRSLLQAALAVTARHRFPKSGEAAYAESIVAPSHTRRRSALTIAHHLFATAVLLAFAPNGPVVEAQDLFVSTGNNIEEFAPNGTESTFATGVTSPLNLAFAPTPAPEPSTLVLLAAGAIGLIGYTRGRRRSAKPNTVNF